MRRGVRVEGEVESGIIKPARYIYPEMDEVIMNCIEELCLESSASTEKAPVTCDDKRCQFQISYIR